jgi:hypothetical protein
MPSTAGRGLRAACSLLTIGMLAGILPACAPATQHYVRVETSLAQARFADADHLVEEHAPQYGRKNQVLYALDRAMTLHYAGQYEESNRFLERAEQLIDDLFTKSVTAETRAMLSNDLTLPYEGEDFETVMINVVAALNYVLLNQWDDALVEARKVDHKLNVINDRYAKKNVYREDAFARYFRHPLRRTGRTQRRVHRVSQSLRHVPRLPRALRHPVPPTLPADLLRVTEARASRTNTRTIANCSRPPRIGQREFRTQAEVIVVSYDGWRPSRSTNCGRADPRRLGRSHPSGRVPARAPPTGLTAPRFARWAGRVAGSQPTFLVEDIAAIAQKDLADRIGRISPKPLPAPPRSMRPPGPPSTGEPVPWRRQRRDRRAARQHLRPGLRTGDTRSWHAAGRDPHGGVLAPPGGIPEIEPDGAALGPATTSRDVTLEAGRKVFIAERGRHHDGALTWRRDMPFSHSAPR